MRRMLAALAVAFAACAPPTTLKNVQVAPETPRPKFKNVIVVGLVKNPATRGNYESDMVKALRAAGVQAEASQALLPIGETPTREALQRLVAERGFDGAMVGMLVDSRTEVRAVPPSAYGGYYGYAGWAGPMARERRPALGQGRDGAALEADRGRASQGRLRLNGALPWCHQIRITAHLVAGRERRRARRRPGPEAPRSPPARARTWTGRSPSG